MLKRCSSYSSLRYCVIHQARVLRSARVMFTFRPLGQTSRRTRSLLGALPMVLRVKVWNQIRHYRQCAGGDLHFINIYEVYSCADNFSWGLLTQNDKPCCIFKPTFHCAEMISFEWNVTVFSNNLHSDQLVFQTSSNSGITNRWVSKLNGQLSSDICSSGE